MRVRRILIAVLSVLAGSAYSQSVTPDQRGKFPCLDKVAGSSEGSVVTKSEIPAEFKEIAPAYVGVWNEPNGTKVCSVLLIRSLSGSGQGSATYTNDEPYKRLHSMGLTVKRDGQKIVLDVYHRSQGWSIDYVSEDGGKTFVMTPGQGYRGPTKSGEMAPVE